MPALACNRKGYRSFAPALRLKFNPCLRSCPPEERHRTYPPFACYKPAVGAGRGKGNRLMKEMKPARELAAKHHKPIRTTVKRVGATAKQQEVRAKMVRCAKSWKKLPESRKAVTRYQDFVRDYFNNSKIM